MTPSWKLVALPLVGVALSLSAAQAWACGMFVPTAASKQPAPQIAQEQVLIVFDAAAGREHLVREIRFDGADASFGFIVPTPAQPDVQKESGKLFQKLNASYPHSPRVPAQRSAGAKGGAVGAAPGVQVIETKRVGSFQASVLKASDGVALSRWLKDNGFKSGPGQSSWLQHFVDLEFFFTAFRYDPPKRRAKDKPAMQSELVRLSFDTPDPYYPYLEPGDTLPRARRLLQVWLVSDEVRLPVAQNQPLKGSARFVLPWKQGQTHQLDRRGARRTFGSLTRLLPKGELWVQTFRDLKVSRAGYSDVVLLPRKPRQLTEAQLKLRVKLASSLDPGLVAVPLAPRSNRKPRTKRKPAPAQPAAREPSPQPEARR